MATNPNDDENAFPRTLGRYTLYRELAAGGVGSVCLARMDGQGGFSRVMVVKRLHRQFAKDPHFVTMFLDEANVAARVRHPNVVSTDDVVSAGDELYLVMEYVAGESLSRLLSAARQRGTRVDPAIAVAIMSGVLEGLHAAHIATNEQGLPLHIVHRDVSPQNVMVGVDGVARVIDFGIAKAVGRHQDTTQSGHVKGKLVYMAPEQLSDGKHVDRRADLWAASVLLWEMIVGKQFFRDATDALRFHSRAEHIGVPSEEGAPDVLDDVVRKGLARALDERFQTAREMLLAMERAVSPAPARRVAQWVEKLAHDGLLARAAYVKEIEGAIPGDAAVASTAISSGDGARVTPTPARALTRWLPLALLVGGLGVAAFRFGTPKLTPRSTVAAAPPVSQGVDVRVVVSASATAPSANARASATPEVPRPAAAVARPPSPAIAKPSKAANCDPPYTVDPATDRKKYKRECFE